jgi:lipoprotein-anchoring transpeptidase ErfK/SrfK
MMAAVRCILLWLAAAATGCGAPADLSVQVDESGRVEVALSESAGLRSARLYRSTVRFAPDPDTVGLPVTVRDMRPDQATATWAFTDSTAAHGVRYYYRVRVVPAAGPAYWTNLDSADTPVAAAGGERAVELWVSKLDYTITVVSGGRALKRYPVALGRSPRRRKLHQDNASTPEGIYRVTALRPRATFHKALDIYYPNAADRVRYAFCLDSGLIDARGGAPGIGGEIQVHGRGIETNWTYGCIALRDADIDELFDWPGVNAGLPVVITGSELSAQDISSIRRHASADAVSRCQRELGRLGFHDGPIDGVCGPATRRALCALQHRSGVPITAEFDAWTVGELERE